MPLDGAARTDTVSLDLQEMQDALGLYGAMLQMTFLHLQAT